MIKFLTKKFVKQRKTISFPIPSPPVSSTPSWREHLKWFAILIVVRAEQLSEYSHTHTKPRFKKCVYSWKSNLLFWVANTLGLRQYTALHDLAFTSRYKLTPEHHSIISLFPLSLLPSFVCLSAHLSVCLSLHPSIHPCIHPLICDFTYISHTRIRMTQKHHYCVSNSPLFHTVHHSSVFGNLEAPHGRNQQAPQLKWASFICLQALWAHERVCGAPAHPCLSIVKGSNSSLGSKFCSDGLLSWPH